MFGLGLARRVRALIGGSCRELTASRRAGMMFGAVDEKSYIRLIQRTGAALQQVKDEELRAAGHPRAAIEALSEAFRFAVRSQPPRASSGLVEYQRLVGRLRVSTAHDDS